MHKSFVRSYGDYAVTTVKEFIGERYSFKIVLSDLLKLKYVRRTIPKCIINVNLPFVSNATSKHCGSLLKSHLYTTPGLASCGTAVLLAFGAPTRSLQKPHRDQEFISITSQVREGQNKSYVLKHTMIGSVSYRRLQTSDSQPKIQSSYPHPLV